MSLSGGCLCGAVRYLASAQPLSVNWCHCSLCRRASGAPALAWASFKATDVVITRGEVATFRAPSTARRGFCPSCGGALIMWIDGSDKVDITVGSLDEAAKVQPAFHLWCESRLPWFETADELPRAARS